MEGVTVRVPATVANLGPGFDCMGFAIDWYNRVTVTLAEKTTIDVSGPGEDRIPRDKANLVLRSMRAWEEAIGAEPAEYAIEIRNESPYGRGLGSSAAAIAGGLVAARELREGDANMVKLAGELEGHLDNVSAALLGGITLSGFAADQAMRLDPPADITPLVCVAPERMSTSAARKALPAEVPFKDAIANASRAALLAAALASGDTTYLLQATEDRLHQPARFALVPDTANLVSALRAEGIAAFLSGAGPSVTALIPSVDAEELLKIAQGFAPSGWDVALHRFDRIGASQE